MHKGAGDRGLRRVARCSTPCMSWRPALLAGLDRPRSGRRAFVEEVAADDAAIHLRNHSVDAGVQISMLVTSVATSREGSSFGKLCCRAIASKAS